MSSGDFPAAGERGQRPLLELRGVQKRYGRTLAVESLDLVLYEGEILTLLGHSGCGKTTTLRMIMGLERCTAGEILHEGRVVDAPVQRKFVPPHKRNMGIVFQSYALWPHMSVFDNVAYPLKVRGIRRGEIRERVMKTLDLVGLADYAKRAPSQLSGGQQQRVALARSIVYEPKLLLLDEPFSNLDAKLREQMRAELKGLQAELGLTVVFVTHDQTEALSISDRIVMMHEGRVEQSGSPLELYSRPSTEVVRDFLGSSIIFDGKVVDRRQSHHFGVAIQPTGNRVVEAYSNGSSDRIAIGDPCRISVRPEHLRVRGSSAAEACDIPAIIQRLLFCGDRYEAVLQFQDGRRGSVYLEADRTWKEGEAVTVGIANGSAILWPGTAHAEAGFGESED